jgi:transcriptional regulator with XRE-family HTH domain
MPTLQSNIIDHRLDYRQSPPPNLIPYRKRERGVILTSQGWQKLQQAQQQAAHDRNFGLRFTREQMSELTGLSLNTIARILKRQEAVDRQSLAQFLIAFGIELSTGDCAPPKALLEVLPSRLPHRHQDWGTAPDVAVCYGRVTELTQLQQWVLTEHCRLVAILGMGGMGKSTLAIKLGRHLQTDFAAVVWRSLHLAPTLDEILDSILPGLLAAQNRHITPAHHQSEKLQQLLACLRSSRCLLILDNVETLLSSGQRVGQWRDGYADYGQLFTLLGEATHQSCTLITSREQPSLVSRVESPTAPVRSLRLSGLALAASQQLFQDKGPFTGTAAAWQCLMTHYGGNPWMLKTVAAVVRDLFNGQIAAVLPPIEPAERLSARILVEDIRSLLESQFNRLSQAEQAVLAGLAHQPCSWATLIKQYQPAAIAALWQRSLLAPASPTFGLPPIVLAYLAERCHPSATSALVASVG